MTKTLAKPSLDLQEKLDNNYPELTLSPLVEELRTRATSPASMPQIVIDMGWVTQAVCASLDTDTFFPCNGAGVKIAKEHCRHCPVRNECLEYALLNEIEHGVWGGASERQRARILKERKAYQEYETQVRVA